MKWLVVALTAGLVFAAVPAADAVRDALARRGPPASFGAFVPGVARDYTASTTALVGLHGRGDDAHRTRWCEHRCRASR